MELPLVEYLAFFYVVIQMVFFGLHVSCLVGVEVFFFKVEVKTSGPFQIHMHFDRLTFG